MSVFKVFIALGRISTTASNAICVDHLMSKNIDPVSITHLMYFFQVDLL